MFVKNWIIFFCLLFLPFAAIAQFDLETPTVNSKEGIFSEDVNDEKNIQAIETFLNRPVPGLPVSYRDVFEALASKGHRVTIIGGVLRDLLNDNPREPSDVDFIYSCTPDELEAILIEHQWQYTRLDGCPLFDIGALDGQFLQGVPENFTDMSDPNQEDFTINQLAYDFNHHRFHEKSRKGFKDLKEGVIRISSKDWEKWFVGNPERNRRDKIFRFWRMVAKGYRYSSEFESFIRSETYALQHGDREYFKREMLKYFAGHIDSYEEALAGCKTVMGRGWAEKNFASLYPEFYQRSEEKQILLAKHTYFSRAILAKSVTLSP